MSKISPAAYIDASATVEDDVTVGSGTKVWSYAHLRKGARIGKNTVIARSVQVDCGVHVGSGCKIQNGVSVYSGVTLEDDVFVGPFAVFTNDLRPRAFNKTWKIVPTVVHKGASIGANATIVCGNEIGDSDNDQCSKAVINSLLESYSPQLLIPAVRHCTATGHTPFYVIVSDNTDPSLERQVLNISGVTVIKNN